MVPVDAALKALAALVSAAFAATLLAGGPRRPANRWLALFLLLIAGNQAAETARALTQDPAAGLAWFRVATVFAALDPLALALFAASHPAFAHLRRAAWLAPLGAATALLVLWTLRLDGFPDSVSAFVVCLQGVTYLVYGAILLAFTRALLARPGDPALRSLVPAMMVVSFPTVFSVATSAVDAYSLLAYGGPVVYVPHPKPMPWDLVVGVATSLALGLAFVWLAAGEGPPARRQARRVIVMGALAAGALALLLQVYNLGMEISRLLDLPPPSSLVLVGRSGAPVRWLLFGAFVSVAALRHDTLGLSLAARRRAARVLVALAFLTLGALLLVLVGTFAPRPVREIRPTDALLLGAVLLLSQGFRSLVDRVALRVYGVPMPADLQGRHETYRLAAVQVVGEGRAPARDARLARLREELALDDATAQVLERLAEETAAGALAEGQRVMGRYRVGPLLGAGAAARVFLARDELLDREVVLKEVPRLPGAEEDRAVQEARMAGGLQHPNVLVVHDAFQRRGSTVLVAEHAAGGSLDRLLERGPLPAPEAWRLLEEVLSGLAAVHARGVVHRDLKPANVLLTADGRAKIADFGLARLRRGTTVDATPGALVGTPEFMAPEQRRGEPATPRTDVYAAGLLARRLFGPQPPPGVAGVVARAVAEAPEARWPSAAAMLDALRRAREREPQAQ